MPDIDYSAIPTQTTSQSQQEWEPPRHVYFGKRLPNGRQEPEPQYKYQAWPSMMYRQRADGTIEARLVNSQAEANGWEDSPAKFGFVTAPTFEEVLERRRAEELAKMEAAVEAPRRGRPPKE